MTDTTDIAMFDVVEVTIAAPHAERTIATNKPEAEAEAIIKMAVARRGVEHCFFKGVPSRQALTDGEGR